MAYRSWQQQEEYKPKWYDLIADFAKSIVRFTLAGCLAIMTVEAIADNQRAHGSCQESIHKFMPRHESEVICESKNHKMEKTRNKHNVNIKNRYSGHFKSR